MRKPASFDDAVIAILLVVVVALAVIMFVVVLPRAVKESDKALTQQEVRISEVWVENTVHGVTWYIASVIIDDTEQREFQFRSFEAFETWLASIRRSKKYILIEENL